ncbi:MAG: efflux RND transporter periplasmic adaptor subunit [Candidatus Scalinduaceae bacterium]
MPDNKIKIPKITLAISGILIFLAGGIIASLLSPRGRQLENMNQGKVKTTETPHVSVQNPLRKTIHRTILLPGDIFPWEQATLFSKIAGYLEEIRFDKGDWVKEGDIIARIAVPELENELEKEQAELAQCKADIARADAEVRLREIIYKRLSEVRATSKDMVSEEQVDEASGKLEVAKAELVLSKSRSNVARANIERTKTFLDYTIIKAPFTGVITNRWVDPGALIQVATTSQKDVAPIVHLMEINTVRVQVHIPEPDTPYIDIGKNVKLTVDELPGKVFESGISRFSWALERGTRTMLVEIDFPNDGYFLRPGMFAKVIINLEAHKDVLTVPAESLITEKDKAYVYVVNDSTVRKVSLKTGIDDGIIVEILDGLDENDKVIVAGKHLVSEGEAVITTEL